MVEPSEKNTFLNSFIHVITLHSSLSHAFDTLLILLIPNKNLRLSLFSSPSILFHYHIIEVMSNASCSSLAYSSCNLIAFIKDPIVSITFLPLATLWWHLAPLHLIHPLHLKYFNSEPSTKTSHFNPSSLPDTITLLLSTWSFRPLYLQNSTKHPIIFRIFFIHWFIA